MKEYKRQVFVINGSAGVGKDTFCNLVGKYVPTRVVSSVDSIKALMKQMGWNGEKTERDRKFMSDLKDLTTEYNDYPMNCIREKVKAFLDDNMWGCHDAVNTHRVLFLHIREPKEIQRAVGEFHAQTILITNPNVEHLTSNHADANVGKYVYNFYINNGGTLDDLEDIAKAFCEDEGLI